VFLDSTLMFLDMPGPLPTGRHSLSREDVLASQRGRLLDAMADAVAEHGYGATTVAHVVALAGVSRKTFYEHFADKEDCFLALYDAGIAYVLGRIADALGDETADDAPRARVAVGMLAFLTVLAEEPAFSRAIILEVHAAGAQAIARRRDTLEVFAQRYEEVNALARAQDPSVPPLSHDIALAVVGAILELVAIRVADGESAQLPQLTEPLTEFVLRQVTPGLR
jgi:AcrR family transcriptional regulator